MKYRRSVAALEIDFDGEAEAFLRDQWTQLAAQGHPLPEGSGPPHVSLAAGLGVGSSESVGNLEEAVRVSMEAAPEALAFERFGTFPGEEQVVYLAAVATPELRRWHETLWPTATRALVGPIDYYAPANWVPHCTLRLGPGRAVEETIRWLDANCDLPIRAEVVRVTLRMYIDGKMTEVWRVDGARRA